MELYQYFRLFHDISQADYQLLSDKLRPKNFRKGEFITTPGMVQKELYFVRSSVQMSHLDAETKIHFMIFAYGVAEAFVYLIDSQEWLSISTDGSTRPDDYSEVLGLKLGRLLSRR